MKLYPGNAGTLQAIPTYTYIYVRREENRNRGNVRERKVEDGKVEMGKRKRKGDTS